MAALKKYNAFPNRIRMVRRFVYGHFAGWFYDDTYRANIDIIWPVTGEQVSTYIKRRYKMSYESEGDFGGKCIELRHPTGSDVNIICLKAWNSKDPIDLSILTHEVFHTAEHILSKRGVRLTESSTEPYAYLIESIMLRSLIILK